MEPVKREQKVPVQSIKSKRMENVKLLGVNYYRYRSKFYFENK